MLKFLNLAMTPKMTPLFFFPVFHPKKNDFIIEARRWKDGGTMLKSSKNNDEIMSIIHHNLITISCLTDLERVVFKS